MAISLRLIFQLSGMLAFQLRAHQLIDITLSIAAFTANLYLLEDTGLVPTVERHL